MGWVEGGRVAAGIASALSYAASREMDKRALSQEALERYRELSLIYDLAQSIGATLEVAAVARVALAEAGRLPGGGAAFLVLDSADAPGGELAAPAGIESTPIASVRRGQGILGAVADGEPEIVNDPSADARATGEEGTVGAIIAAPLRVRGGRIGLIGAIAPAGFEYRAADLKVLTAIAALAGPAIEQARTHEAALESAAS
jgi:GAF domain-containing protein